ncbi:protein kinase domain containing protein [Theileria equi strain WA]|uniref:Protein kinase domain containing protein n=1 Tax=Theileria equi strain WA TaxID=1537102 RepID=L0AUG5_THEEQ|nr:protein kinase domain containing protein [Theileria equi strain WA]AFZ79272.1 protein kinase domain containing protein [Theileria equi strain WA]|eukprot:XP_004828938.1 protein kinase domain containing protein [Theileria equi strain WA]
MFKALKQMFSPKKKRPASAPKLVFKNRPKLSIESFKFIKTLGTGGFGRVFLAVPNEGLHIPSPCAIKRLKKHPLIVQKQIDHVLSEKRLLGSVNHPFIVNMIGTFKDDYYLFIVMQYVRGGDFFSFLRKTDRLKSEDAMFYAAQVTLMFEYLHSNRIIYRDLKPENLLLDSSGYLLLTDFGFAKVVEFRTYTLCGTPEYIAPEILLNKGHGKAVDWWTMGILIYEMLVGYPPFYDEDPISIYKKILECRLSFPVFYNSNAKELTQNLLAFDPSKRFGNLHKGVDDVKGSAWFHGVDFDKLLHRGIKPPHVPVSCLHHIIRLQKYDDDSSANYPESVEKPKAVVGNADPFVNW